LSQPARPKENAEALLSETGRINTTRAGIYNFLSRAFKVEVDEAFLKEIVAIEPAIRSLSDSQSGEETNELEQGSRELLDFAKRIKPLNNDERKKLLQDLAVEYANLFLGVGLKHVYLSESVYLGKDHLLYEAPYHEIIEAYKSLGFTKDEKFTEPEDHVAVEFEFMALLCRWATQTMEKHDIENALTYLSLQKEFLEDHLFKWVPELCRKLDDATTGSFYKALAHLTLGFVTMDNEIPDHIMGILKDSFSVEISKMKIETDGSVTYNDANN
jgi:TorA maturation chaperone TorD